MTKSEALDKLIAAVEMGESIWPGDLDGTGLNQHQTSFGIAYNGSLDAAIALKSALVPKWFWRVTETVEGATAELAEFVDKIDCKPIFTLKVYSLEDPARALLIATLKAYRAGL